MVLKNSNGMTLISLVVSIIVLLILSGISMSFIVGEDGILSRAMDAKIMTQLSDDLFEMESDVVNIRIGQLGRKLKISEVIDGLINNGTGKYSVSEMTGMHTSDIILSNTRTNPTIAYTGDVYIDNYKRGKIELADISSTIDIPSLGYGDFSVTVNDGAVSYEDEICTIRSTESHPVLWINQDSEIMAFSQTLKFKPSGILDNYEISQLDIFNIDSAFDTVKNLCDGKYVFNVTFDYRKDNDGKYKLEAFAYHFTENVEFAVGDKKITIGGMEVKAAGILHAKTKKELEGLVNLFNDKPDQVQATMLDSILIFNEKGNFNQDSTTGPIDCGDNGRIDSWLYEMTAEDLGLTVDIGRVYYTPFIVYQKWVKIDGEWQYSPMPSTGTANYMSYIDL